MWACHLFLICWSKLKKTPKFHNDEYWSQEELSDSLLLELMNPQRCIITLSEDQPERGKEILCEQVTQKFASRKK